MAMDVVSVQGIEAAHPRIELAAQAMSDSLADHGPLLARNRQQVGLLVGQDLLAKRGVELLHRPGGVTRRDVAELQMRNAQAASELLSGVLERLGSLLVARRDTTVDGERQADERMAEQQALDPRQRQDPFNPTVNFGAEEVCLVAE